MKSDLEVILKKSDSSDNEERLFDSYFRPKSFERSGKIYELLGVRFFKKIHV